MTQTARDDSIAECPGCRSQDIDESLDEFDGVCQACGVVIRDAPDPSSPDWMVEESDSDGNSQEWLEFCRIRNSTENRLAHAFDTVEEFGEAFTSVDTETRLETADIYADAVEAEATAGRDTESVIAASLRLASIRVGTPIPQSRLTDLSGVAVQKFRKSLASLSEDVEDPPETPTPLDYVPFLDSTLEMANSEVDDVKRVLESVDSESAMAGKDPAAIAAAAAYCTTSELTQSTVADAVGVSTETIRLRSKEITQVTDD